MTIGNCQLASSFRPLCKSALRSVRRFLTNGTVQLRNRLCKSSRSHRITALPNDLQLNILSYLPPEDVLSAKLVCRQWNALINRYPTSTHRFPIEITVKNPANGNCEVWVEVKQTASNCFTNAHQLFPQRFQVTFEKLESWNDLLQHCIVESIVLDGSNRSKKAKFKPNAANQLDDYIIERICNLLRRLNASKRLCELQTFTMCNWTIAENQSAPLQQMLKMAISAPLQSFRLNACRGIRGKLSPCILASIFKSKIQILEVDFQYFYNRIYELSMSSHLLNALLSDESSTAPARTLHIKNIPYATEKVLDLAERWSRQKTLAFNGRLILRVANATDVLPIRHLTKHRLTNQHHPNCFMEITVKNKNTIQLETGVEINTGAPLNLRMNAYKVGVDHFCGRAITRIHVVNCGSSCIAVNVRLSNRECHMEPNFFVMFDTKDLYLTTPNDHKNNDSICFECFPFANLPTVLFDPAWFSPTASYQEYSVRLNQILT